MVNDCKECQYQSVEQKKADTDVDGCKMLCLENPGCVGINVAKSKSECYFVESTGMTRSAPSSDYQAWKKSTSCISNDDTESHDVVAV